MEAHEGEDEELVRILVQHKAAIRRVDMDRHDGMLGWRLLRRMDGVQVKRIRLSSLSRDWRGNLADVVEAIESLSTVEDVDIVTSLGRHSTAEIRQLARLPVRELNHLPITDGNLEECLQVISNMKTLRTVRSDVQIIRLDTSMGLCARGALRRRLLSAKSRAYCCCLHLWLPIAR